MDVRLVYIVLGIVVLMAVGVGSRIGSFMRIAQITVAALLVPLICRYHRSIYVILRTLPRDIKWVSQKKQKNNIYFPWMFNFFFSNGTTIFFTNLFGVEISLNCLFFFFLIKFWVKFLFWQNYFDLLFGKLVFFFLLDRQYCLWLAGLFELVK